MVLTPSRKLHNEVATMTHSNEQDYCRNLFGDDCFSISYIQVHACAVNCGEEQHNAVSSHILFYVSSSSSSFFVFFFLVSCEKKFSFGENESATHHKGNG